MSQAWQGDWHARIHKLVKQLGYSSVTAFAASRPGKAWPELADDLDVTGVAGIQIQWILYEEARRRNDVLGFAKDCLVRYLRRWIPAGWGKGDNFWSEAGGAYGSWISSLGESYKAHAKRAWKWLEVQDIPEGWLPAGPDDPWIEAMFRESGFPGAGEPAKPL